MDEIAAVYKFLGPWNCIVLVVGAWWMSQSFSPEIRRMKMRMKKWFRL